MTFHLQTDKNPFQFYIIFIGMNPLNEDWAGPICFHSYRFPAAEDDGAALIRSVFP